MGKSNTEDVSNIGLGPPSSREPLIDIASGPLADFLVLEKLHQPRPPLPYFLQQEVCSPVTTTCVKLLYETVLVCHPVLTWCNFITWVLIIAKP